jgi:hypothetical protein
MSIPLWKWAHEPSGGSHGKPVQPNSWVTGPEIGQASVPLYWEGMLPLWPPALRICWIFCETEASAADSALIALRSAAALLDSLL